MFRRRRFLGLGGFPGRPRACTGAVRLALEGMPHMRTPRTPRVDASAADSGASRAPGGGTAPRRPAPAGGPAAHGGGDGDGEWPGEDLRRTIDDIDSGRIETTDYSSAKEYLDHLNSASDD